MLRNLFGALLALVLLCPAVQAAEPPLRVGLSPDYEPLAFMRDGEIVGIEAHNAAEVAAFLGRPLELVPMPFEQLFPSLLSGKIDVVMSGISVSPEREKQLSFVSPFMEIGQMAIVRQADVARFAYPRALYQPGVRIGVEPGTTGERLVRESMPEAVVVHVADAPAAFKALRANTADVYIHDAPTSWRLANSTEDQDLFGLYRPLSSEQLAWAVKPGNKLLLHQLNAAREELERNGRLQAIQNFWIPVRVQVR